MTTVRVRRKPLLPFFVALAGLPLIAIAFDFATGARLLRQIGDVVYASDVDPFELRDSFLASLFGFVGAGMVVWGLRELVFPQSVVKAEADSLRLAVRGPLGKLTNVPWDELEEIAATTRELDGHVVPALAVTVTRPGELPDHPWNARWVGHTLVVDADHWDHPLDEVVNEIVRLRRAALTASPPMRPAPPEASDAMSEEPVPTEAGEEAPVTPADVPDEPIVDPTADEVGESETPSPGADADLDEVIPASPEGIPTDSVVADETIVEVPLAAEPLQPETLQPETPEPDHPSPDTEL